MQNTIREPRRYSIFGLFDASFGGLILIIFLSFLLVGGCSYRAYFLKSVDSYELAYRWDKRDGSITVLKRAGWHKVIPFMTRVHTVDLRPMQIKIEANNRVLNAMLVKFKPEGLKQFIDMHGRGNYDQTKLGDILKSYAYEGYGDSTYSRDALQRKYKFLEILGRTSSPGPIPATLKDSL